MVNTYRLIKANNFVWSISLQSQISFKDDIIVEVTNTCSGSDYLFGKLKDLIFNLPGYIPYLIDKGKDSDIGFDISISEDYKIPDGLPF